MQKIFHKPVLTVLKSCPAEAESSALRATLSKTATTVAASAAAAATTVTTTRRSIN